MKRTLLFLSAPSDLTNNLVHHAEQAQFQVLLAENEYDAVLEAQRQQINAIILVLRGFEKKCIQIINQLKTLSRFARVIVINNSEQLQLSIKCMKAGAFEDFLPPVDIHRLEHSIRTAIDQQQTDLEKTNEKLSRIDRLMMAISFAEAGEQETALKYLNKENQRREPWKK